MLVILLHGDLTTLSNIDFNKGDLIFIVALVDLRTLFGAVAETSRHPRPVVCRLHLRLRRGLPDPAVHLGIVHAPGDAIDAANLLTLFYVAVFPSTLAYLCFNRGVQLIGANRAAPFFHVVPVFGTVMSIAFLGEHPQAFHFIGFALVLTGVFVASRKPKTA